MKKILYSILVLISVGITSCSKDFLETESKSQYTPDVVFASTDYTNFALNGIYSLLTSDYSYSQRLALQYAVNSDIEWVGADASSYSQDTYRGLSNYLASPGNDALVNEWNNLYKIIERSNLCISGIKNSPVLVNGTADAKTKMMAYYGEALTLRALAYYDLVRHWGDVPFKTEPTSPDGSNFYQPAVDRDTIYDHIINDLLEAQTYVPWIKSGTSNTTERISKGFVKGLLARICLYRGGYSIRNKTGNPTERGSDWQKYYRIANEQCRDVMNSGVHSLNNSYRNVWEKLNSWQTDLSTCENLFEVAMGYQRSGEAGYSIGVRFYKNTKYGYGNNSNVVQTGAYYYYMFNSNDLRRDATVAWYQYSDNSGTIKEFFKSNPMDWNFAKWDQRMMSSAFANANKAANGKVGYGVNWVLMRYSDILLMFAETENELNNGPTGEAKAALKQVRRRAFPASLQAQMVDNYVDTKASKDDFFNAIVDERAFEFGGEGIRKYDLIRWNLLGKKIQDQRDAFSKMLNREAPYDQLPRAIYYKYNATGNTDEIDRTDINFYTDKGTAAIAGYEKVDWLSGASDLNKQSYKDRVTAFSSGLNSKVPNRHLFPIHSTVISESGGLLKNSYGY